jgi:CRP-like cAMP-binding protein
VSLVLAHVDLHAPGKAHLGALSALGARCCASVDTALEYYEDGLLTGACSALSEPPPVLAVHELLEGLGDAEIAAVDDIAELVLAKPGDALVREGDEGDTMFFLLSGTVSVQVQLEAGRTHRLSTLAPGVAFGELAMLGTSPRSADVVATDDAMLARVRIDDLRDLAGRFPNLMTTISRNLAANLAGRLRAANEQIRALDQ